MMFSSSYFKNTDYYFKIFKNHIFQVFEQSKCHKPLSDTLKTKLVNLYLMKAYQESNSNCWKQLGADFRNFEWCTWLSGFLAMKEKTYGRP